MPITSQIGSSSLIKPGVIDSAATRPASPYEGQVIFQKDTDQLLVWNGTAWVIPNSPAQNPQGLEFITSGTGTSISTTPTQYTSVFNNTNYFNYKLIIQTTAASTSNKILFKFISGTTAASTAYYAAGVGCPYNTNSTIYFERSSNATSLSLSAADTVARVTALEIIAPNQAVATMFSGFHSETNNQSAWTFGGTHGTTTAYDGFQLETSAGTQTVNYQLYGYRK